ncbi:ATP-binding protein [Buchnera aphidicola]|uniref:ATP-binding protein n=1 Tax=Buchnera aphidicola TaxID=9 RepID=UPI0030EF9ACF
MKKLYNIISEIKSIIPKDIKPKFKNAIDLLKWNQKQGMIYSKNILKKNTNLKKKTILKNSGIKKLYLNCSFKNYNVKNIGQKKALKLSIKYVKNFNLHISNFIFSGNPGTGKNHLATSIIKKLILQKKNTLIISITELMSHIKNTFNNNFYTESELIKKFSILDLLIIDEIGVQKKSEYEQITLHRIIEKRCSNKKSTGILSNLNFYEIKKILGERILDRMRLGKSLWINFNWESYRKNIF